MLRGDDVAELQQRLCTLGFDTGRVDGIFGDATARPSASSSATPACPVDGIVGGATLRELLRLESRHHEPELVSAVRARAALRDAPPTLRGRHVAVGESGGLGSVTGALRRRLTIAGTRVTELHHPDDAVQAQRGQRAGRRRLRRAAAQPLGLGPAGPRSGPAPTTSPPGGAGWPSWSSRPCPRRSASADAGVHGMSVPVLRETRMPAVLVEVGPASAVVERARPWPRPSRPPSAAGPTLLGLITGNHVEPDVSRANRLRATVT